MLNKRKIEKILNFNRNSYKFYPKSFLELKLYEDVFLFTESPTIVTLNSNFTTHEI